MSSFFDYSHAIGTRQDPHAQEREARSQPLLLHSMSVFREIFAIIFDHREISTVVEVGVESGAVSGVYAELGASSVYCVDPQPTEELRANLAGNDALHVVEKSSPEVFTDLPLADLYVLDGDHNYAVVSQELHWILAHAPDAVVVLHDVLWPCSRRDLYYEPSPLSSKDKHPASSDGPTVWHDDLTPAGFVGLHAFTSSVHAGGERNGVLTAVEDALSQAHDDEWHFELIPAVFGMGVVVRQTSPSASRLIDSLRPYSGSRLLAAMENNRIALYTRLLQFQYEAARHAGDADKLADSISAQRREIEALEADLETSKARHAAEVQGLQRETQRLEQLPAERATQPRIGAMVKDLGHIAASQLRKARPRQRG